MSNNFLQWNPGAVNQENDAAYAADSVRSGGAPTNAIFPSNLANKAFYQWSIMIAALGQMLSDKGFAVSDADFNNLKTVLANIVLPGDLVGLRVSRNLFSNFSEIVHTGTTAETTIYSTTIPANTLGINNRLQISTNLIIQSQSATPSTLRLRYGSAVIFSQPIPSGVAAPSYGNIWLRFAVTPRNLATNLQCTFSEDVFDFFPRATFPLFPGFSGVDTTIDQQLLITIQNGSISDSQRWENLIVDLN